MRSVSPPPSTPAGLRGTEWVTVLSPGGRFGTRAFDLVSVRVWRVGVVVVCFRLLGLGWPGRAGRCGAGAFPNFFFLSYM